MPEGEKRDICTQASLRNDFIIFIYLFIAVVVFFFFFSQIAKISSRWKRTLFPQIFFRPLHHWRVSNAKLNPRVDETVKSEAKGPFLKDEYEIV